MKSIKAISLALVAAILLTVTPASADDWHRGRIHEFHSHDFHAWRGGNWHHGYYGGRLGWWWIVGGMWYYYPQPIYPYPDPYTPPVVIVQQSPAVVQVPAPSVPQAQPPVVQQAPAPAPAPAPSAPPQPQYWYFCESSKSYYPYVPTCPEEWKKVPATPAKSGQ